MWKHLTTAIATTLGWLLVHVRVRTRRKKEHTCLPTDDDQYGIIQQDHHEDDNDNDNYDDEEEEDDEEDDEEEEDDDYEDYEVDEDLDHISNAVEVTFATRGSAQFDAGEFFRSLSQHVERHRAVRLHDLPGFVRWPGCLDLSSRMPGLAVLAVSHCRIKSLFSEDLTLPPRLRRLSLTYNCLEEFEVYLPRSLRDLDISFNKLTRLPACLENIRDLVLLRTNMNAAGQQQHCRLNVRNNNFWFNEYSDITPGRVNRDTMVELTRAHDWGLICSSKLQRAMSTLGMTMNWPATTIRHKVARHKTTYEDPQNVHKSSVQASVIDSITRLMEDVDENNNKKKNTFDPNFVETLVKKMRLSRKVAATFRIDCASAIVHSGLDVTFGNLCERLLSFVSSQPAADEIFNIMGKEYARNSRVCFTGKVTHLLACLNGFVDGFAVGINTKDELANQLITIRNKWARLAGDDFAMYVAEALPEAMQVLEDACVPASEQEAWLDGI